MQAYLNAADEVIAVSMTAYTLAQAQAINANVVSIVTNAPVGLVPKSQADAANPFYHQRTSGDGTSMVHYIEVPALLPLKITRAAEIDARTEELIAEGFVASNGKRFAITDCAMLRYHVLFTARDAAIAYPVLINTYGNDGVQSLANSTQVVAFVEEIFVGHQGVIASGSALKQQIINATSVAEINAVIDNR